jgi:SAM-dependent methyltransferase
MELITIGLERTSKGLLCFMPTKTFVESHLKAWDKEYAKHGRLWGGSVKDLPPLTEGSAVLELGCGDGKTLASMPSDWKIVALDVSREALHLAHRMRGDAALILADASCLPLQDERFDAVFAFHVTGHLLEKDRRTLASEAARALVPGGQLFFRDFCEKDMRAGLGEEVETGSFLRGGGILTHYFRESEVRELFCELLPASIGTRCWKLRIKGEALLRAEVVAVFLKSLCPGTRTDRA